MSTGPEYDVPDTLTNDEAKDLSARGAAQIETDDLQHQGTVKQPEQGFIETPVEQMVDEDKNRYDALEAAKDGHFEGITDSAEKARLIERFQQEGQKGLDSLVESLQKTVTEAPVDAERLATIVAEKQLGTNNKDTLRMEMGIAAAKQGVEQALAQGSSQTPEATNQ
jgi:hypothetical protein